MTKPIRYYINCRPQDNRIIDWIEEQYGSYLEGLSAREKVYLIKAIADNLLLRANGEVRSQIASVQYEIFRMPTNTQESIIEALIAQLRDM